MNPLKNPTQEALDIVNSLLHLPKVQLLESALRFEGLYINLIELATGATYLCSWYDEEENSTRNTIAYQEVYYRLSENTIAKLNAQQTPYLEILKMADQAILVDARLQPDQKMEIGGTVLYSRRTFC